MLKTFSFKQFYVIIYIVMLYNFLFFLIKKRPKNNKRTEEKNGFI